MQRRCGSLNVMSCLSLPGARFRRNGRGADRAYARCAMMIAINIDMRIVRRFLHAGRLQTGG
jgi:hypothetical protein